jgi:hypothetical protein
MRKKDVTIIVGNYKQDEYVKAAELSAKNQIIPYNSNVGVMPKFDVVVSTDVDGIGAAAHRNKAINLLVDTPWVIWLDADDLLPSHYLYFVWREIYIREMTGLCAADRIFVCAPAQFHSGCRLDRINGIHIESEKILPFGMSCLFSKDQWNLVGGFDETQVLNSMEDLDFWLRLERAGNKCTLAYETFMFKRDVPNSNLKRGETNADKTLAYFNTKHGTDLMTKVLPYWVPQEKE